MSAATISGICLAVTDVNATSPRRHSRRCARDVVLTRLAICSNLLNTHILSCESLITWWTTLLFAVNLAAWRHCAEIGAPWRQCRDVRWCASFVIRVVCIISYCVLLLLLLLLLRCRMLANADMALNGDNSVSHKHQPQNQWLPQADWIQVTAQHYVIVPRAVRRVYCTGNTCMGAAIAKPRVIAMANSS